MSCASHTLAIRYAQAFLNVFDDAITVDHIASFYQASDFFGQHKTRLALALAPYLDSSSSVALLTKVCVDAGIPNAFEHMVRLLVHERRLSLLAAVLIQIGEQYKRRHAIIACLVTSSHELSEHEKQTVHLFLERTTRCKLIEQYGIDEKLIAGIRVVGDGLFWEYSVRRYLAEVSRQLIC